MNLRFRKKQSISRPAAAIMAGVLSLSLLPPAALSVRAEESDTEPAPAAASDRLFPESFDLRHCDTDGDGVFENYVTPVRLQNPFGTCWAFGATAAAEISLLGSGIAQADGYGPVADPEKGVKELNLSEKHLAYFTLTALNDRNNPQNGEGLQFPAGATAAQRLDSGGVLFYAVSMFSSGIGPNLEDRGGLDPEDEGILAYHGKNGFVEFRRAILPDGTVKLTPVWYSPKDDWSIPEKYRFTASYSLREAYQLPSPAVKDEANQYVYNPEGTNAIKEQLLAKRGVAISYCAENFLPGQDVTEKKYMSDAWAHYTWDQEAFNHGVCIVGWDDSFPRERFLEGHQPPADGAWLVKNNWGSATNSSFDGNGYRDWGIRDADGNATGYFWLSYYDKSLTAPTAFVFEENTAAAEYTVLQHDYLPAREIIETTAREETGAANVFRAESDSVLSQISFRTGTPGTEVSYEVYLLDEDFDDPTGGAPVFRGSETYPWAGVHKVIIPASERVELKQGQLFSVVVKERTPAGDWIFILPQIYTGSMLEAFGLSNTPHGIINEGESFLFTGGGWHDMSDEVFRNGVLMIKPDPDSGTVKPHVDNFPIKAYLESAGGTKNKDIDPDPDQFAEPAYDGTLTMNLGKDLTLLPGKTRDVMVNFTGTADAVKDPDQSITWTSGDTSVFVVEPSNPEINDGTKRIHAVGVGSAELTADAGPYGKKTIIVTVARREFELVILDEMQPVYTGRPIEPKPLVVGVTKEEDEPTITAEEGRDYRVEYKNNIQCGKAQVILVGVGDYEGVERVEEFTILPARGEITGTKLRGDTLTVSFASQKDSGIDGYQLSWRPVGDGSAAPQPLDLPADAVSAEITGLKAGEIYTVSLRAYQAPDEETKARAEELGQTAPPTYGQYSVPTIISTCTADDSCPLGAFGDLRADAWYHDAVHWAVAQGVMNGVTADSFAPDGDTTRAMVVTMLWRLAGAPESKTSAGFLDVDSGAWYARAVDWAAENGIVTGYSDTVFAPDDPVTREQLAVILHRRAVSGVLNTENFIRTILAAYGKTLPEKPEGAEIAALFDDAASVSPWAVSGVNWAVKSGILNGKSEKLLAPGDNAKRTEVAAMLLRNTAVIAG